jgi:hypothetical protein
MWSGLNWLRLRSSDTVNKFLCSLISLSPEWLWPSEEGKLHISLNKISYMNRLCHGSSSQSLVPCNAGTGFPVSNLVFPCQYHSKAPYFYFTNAMTLSNPSNWQRCSIKHLTMCPITMEAWVQSQNNPCSIFGGQVAGSSLGTSDIYYLNHSISIIYLYFIHLPVMLYNLSKWQHH